MKNWRQVLLEKAIEFLDEINPSRALHIIEVGCMFKEDEGLSTLIIAKKLVERPAGGKFISIEYDQKHIEASKAILGRRAPECLPLVDFRCGHSLALLGAAVNELGPVHLFWLDGGAHPEVCLHEFEIAADALEEDGIILEDDIVQLNPSEAYPLPRPLGKGTLIVPMVLLSHYLQHREKFHDANTAPDGPDTRPNSLAVNAVESLTDSFRVERQFALSGTDHKILVYASQRFMNRLPAIEATFPPSFIRLLHKLLRRLEYKLGLC